MNAITFLVVVTALAADNGRETTRDRLQNGRQDRPPSAAARRDATAVTAHYPPATAARPAAFGTRFTAASPYSGPDLPLFPHAAIHASSALDDLPERPRVDVVPYSERSALWGNRRTTPELRPDPRGYDNSLAQRPGAASQFGQNQFGQNTSSQNLNGQNLNGQNTYGQNTYGQNTSNTNQYGQSAFGQNAYGQPAASQVQYQQQPPYGQTPNSSFTDSRNHTQPGYNSQPYGAQQPGYNNQQPNYNSQPPGYNTQQPAYNTQQLGTNWANLGGTAAWNSNNQTLPPGGGVLMPPPATRWNDPTDISHLPRANASQNGGAYGGAYGSTFGANNPSYANPNLAPVPNPYGQQYVASTQQGGTNYGATNYGTTNPPAAYGQFSTPRVEANDPNVASRGYYGVNDRNLTSTGTNRPFSTDDGRGRSLAPPASLSPHPASSTFSTTFASLLLFASLGGNIYLGWLARDFYWRYRDLVWESRGAGPSHE